MRRATIDRQNRLRLRRKRARAYGRWLAGHGWTHTDPVLPLRPFDTGPRDRRRVAWETARVQMTPSSWEVEVRRGLRDAWGDHTQPELPL